MAIAPGGPEPGNDACLPALNPATVNAGGLGIGQALNGDDNGRS
jgi:hypothetical protein